MAVSDTSTTEVRECVGCLFQYLPSQGPCPECGETETQELVLQRPPTDTYVSRSFRRGDNVAKLIREQYGYKGFSEDYHDEFVVEVNGKEVFRTTDDFFRAERFYKEECDKFPMPPKAWYRQRSEHGDRGAQPNFTWGKVVAIHEVGEYQIVEYVPNQSSNVSDADYAERLAKHPTSFHPYIKGDDTSRSYHSLDEALVGVIAYRHDGLNSQAAGYFGKMIGAW